jgi:hypothetical protein
VPEPLESARRDEVVKTALGNAALARERVGESVGQRCEHDAKKRSHVGQTWQHFVTAPPKDEWPAESNALAGRLPEFTLREDALASRANERERAGT